MHNLENNPLKFLEDNAKKGTVYTMTMPYEDYQKLYNALVEYQKDCINKSIHTTASKIPGVKNKWKVTIQVYDT